MCLMPLCKVGQPIKGFVQKLSGLLENLGKTEKTEQPRVASWQTENLSHIMYMGIQIRISSTKIAS